MILDSGDVPAGELGAIPSRISRRRPLGLLGAPAEPARSLSSGRGRADVCSLCSRGAAAGEQQGRGPSKLLLDASTGARSGAGRQGVAGTGGRKPERGAGWWVGWQEPRARGASVLGLHPGSMHPQGANCTPFAWAELVCSPGALGDCNCANKMARKSKKSVCSLSFVPCWPQSWCPLR